MDVISGFNVHAPHLIDRRAGPYQSVSDALAAIPMNGRREGLTVVITGNPQQEYWWKDGISDAHLQLKTGAPKPSLKYVLNNVQSIVITHGLQDYPTVVVLDNNMRQVFCDVSYIDLDNVSLSFSMFFNGLAVLTN